MTSRLKQSILLLPASVCALLLVACDPSPLSRQCGVFDHPDLSLWQREASGGTQQFLGEDGSVQTYRQEAIVFNTPYIGSSSVNSVEQVPCFLTATSLMRSDDGELAFVTQYVQRERTFELPEQEQLAIETFIESPVGNRTIGSFYASLEGPEDQLTTVPTNQVTFLGDVEIGGIQYQNTLKIDALDLSDLSADDEEAAADFISQLIFAYQYGLIAYSDEQGNEFVRINK